MSEKIFACLLCLYPASFRAKYSEEALQLYRDRRCDETGFLCRMRLSLDLLADAFVGLPQAYRNTYAAESVTSLAPNADTIPSFRILEKEPMRPGAIFAGSILSLTALVVFGFVMSLPIGDRPISASVGPKSPIETVLERLNRPTLPAASDSTNQEKTKSASAAQSGSPTPASSAVDATVPAQVPQGRPNAAREEVSVRAVPQGLNRQFVGSGLSKRILDASVIGQKQPGFAGPSGKVVAKPWPSVAGNPTLAAQAANTTQVGHVERGETPAYPAQPKLENAAAAMMHLFQTHDIVMLGEVHDSKQEYEWLCRLVKTPGFSSRVDDIVVEFGNPLYQKTVDRYVAGQDVPFDEVQNAWRNMIADVEPVSPVYGWLYQAVREANLQHPGQRGIRLLMGSPPGDWNKIKTTADLAPYEAEREQWYAQVVKQEVLAKHHHALLIMGAWHFLRGHEQALQDELASEQHREASPVDRARLAPGYIERELRAAGANPYLVVFGTNMVDNHGDADKRFDSWPAPVIVPLAGNWVGTLPAQPIISGGHAPAIPLTLANQADALLYIAPCSALQTVYLTRAALDGTPYGREMIRRNTIEVGHPVNFQYGEVPQCVQSTQPAH